MSAARYLMLCAAALCGFAIIAGLNAWAQAGAPTRNGYYTCSYIDAKVMRGSAMPSPKLVIIAGSNALAGIDTRRLAHTLDIHAFDFGLSASMGPGFQIFEGSKILRPGDAVLLPLEYLAYNYSTPQDSLVDAVYSCGGDYWRSLNWRQRLFFVLAVKPWRIFDSWMFVRRKAEMAKVRAEAFSDVGPYGQGHPIDAKANVATHQPLEIHFVRDSPGVRAIVAFVHWARRHHVTVFATWPNTLYFPQYAQQKVFARIADFYRSLGIDMLGTPQQAMFPPSQMADTIYHTNPKGMEVRTSRLIRLFNHDPRFVRWRAHAQR
ncbi:MAG: hypothetical protein KGO02_22205 [Alphaproteobacteria bacterium]|nr:hypothetical protein [Alphaproteobacteria bacterium]